MSEEPTSLPNVKLWEAFLCLLAQTPPSLWPAFPFVFCVVSEKPGVFLNFGLFSSQAWVISRGLVQAAVINQSLGAVSSSSIRLRAWGVFPVRPGV